MRDHNELVWKPFKLSGGLREIKQKEAGDFFANEGRVSLGSPFFQTNGTFLTTEQLYHFISPSTL